MLNFPEAIRGHPSYNKLEIGDFLFAEYTCGATAKLLPNWAETDYLVHVVTGRKTWHTGDGVWKAAPGETLFFKKGANIVEQHFEEDVCMLLFFIPDRLVRDTVRELTGSATLHAPSMTTLKSAARVEKDLGLSAFFQSMQVYFAGKEKPSEPLIRLKLKELIISVMTGGRNAALAAYFRNIGECDAPPVAEIMEANFRFNLSMEEYARLCHRSLSSFKREFQTIFHEPPGKWLLHRRLDHAAALLRNSERSVTEVAFDSGFEDVSHFSRAFKNQFGESPAVFKKGLLVS